MVTAQDVYEHLLSNKKFKLHNIKGDWFDARRLNSHQCMLGETAAEVDLALREMFMKEVSALLRTAPKSVPELFNTVIALCICDEKSQPFFAVHKDHISKLNIKKREDKRLLREGVTEEDITFQRAISQCGYSTGSYHTWREKIVAHLEPGTDYKRTSCGRVLTITPEGLKKMPEVMDKIGMKKARAPYIAPRHDGMKLGPGR